jgi:hypothetical protein
MMRFGVRIGRPLAAVGAAAIALAMVGTAQARTTTAPALAGQASPAAKPPAHRQICPGSCRTSHRAKPVKLVKPVRPGAGHRPRRGVNKQASITPPTGSWGFDMNGHGCNGSSWEAGASPAGIANAAHLGFDAIQLNGWGWAGLTDDNPCYQAQAQWYAQNNPGRPLQLIMFPVPYDNNNCNSYSTSASDGHTAGWDQAQMIYQQAAAGGLAVNGTTTWWLDVEGAQCNDWDPSKPAINLGVIQGAVDYLHSQGVTVGIYSDSYDWNRITASNTTQFAGIPAWNADPYNPSGGPFVTVTNTSSQTPYDWSSVLSWAQGQCGNRGITGGPQQVVQYLWGATNANEYTTTQSPAILGRDFDYVCRGPSASSALTDLFLYNQANGSSYVELANGAGGWTAVPGSSFSAGWNVYPGDFNGDGLTDYFLYNPTSGASYVELANGSGGWTAVKGPAFAAGWNVYPGDLNGDGRADLFLYNPASGDSYVEFADGAGGWTGSVKGPVFSAGWTIYPGNFNSDGLTDFFLYNPTSGASYVELANGSGGWTGVKGPAFAAGWTFYPGNLNSDGLTDMFAYNQSTGDSYVEFANGSGGWTGGVHGSGFSAGWNIYPGNFNSDGLTDYFLYNPTSGASYVELANGSGGWTSVKGPAFATGWTFYPANLNGDGVTDLFAYNQSTGDSYVEFADGSGNWTGGVHGSGFSAGWNVYPGQLG